MFVFVFFCFFIPFIIFALLFSLPPSRKAGSPPPLPLRFEPCIFIARRLHSALSSPVDSSVPTYVYKISQVSILEFRIIINSGTLQLQRKPTQPPTNPLIHPKDKRNTKRTKTKSTEEEEGGLEPWAPESSALIDQVLLTMPIQTRNVITVRPPGRLPFDAPHSPSLCATPLLRREYRGLLGGGAVARPRGPRRMGWRAGTAGVKTALLRPNPLGRFKRTCITT